MQGNAVKKVFFVKSSKNCRITLFYSKISFLNCDDQVDLE